MMKPEPNPMSIGLNSKCNAGSSGMPAIWLQPVAASSKMASTTIVMLISAALLTFVDIFQNHLWLDSNRRGIGLAVVEFADGSQDMMVHG